MALSELLHAWELLKKGALGGIIVGLAFGLYMQDFPLMSVLYSLSHHEGSVALESARIVYWVTDLQPPFDPQRHELNLVTLILWTILGSGVASLAFGKVANRRSKTKAVVANNVNTSTTEVRRPSQPDERNDKEG